MLRSTREPPAGHLCDESREMVTCSAIIAGVLALVISCSEPPRPLSLAVYAPIDSSVLVDASTLPEGAWDPIHLHYDGDMVYVADRLSSTVLVFDMQGNLVSSVGYGRGAGPGEVQVPADVQTDATGRIWVLDPPQGRITAFSSAGEYEQSLISPTPSYAVLGDGKELFLAPAFGGPATIWGGDRQFTQVAMADLSEGAGLFPPVMFNWLVAGLSGTEVVLVDNVTGRASRLRRAEGNTWERVDIAFPRPIARLAQSKNEERRRALGALGASAQIPLYREVRAIGPNTIWLFTGWHEALGVVLDLESESASIIIPSSGNEQAFLKGAVPFGETRLLALYDEGLRVLLLAQGEIPEWLGRTPTR